VSCRAFGSDTSSASDRKTSKPSSRAAVKKTEARWESRASSQIPPGWAVEMVQQGSAESGRLSFADVHRVFGDLPPDVLAELFTDIDAPWCALSRECAERREEARSREPDVPLPTRLADRRRSRDRRRSLRAVGDRCDDLLAIPPPLYVELLTGIVVGPSGMIRCPFSGHEDRSPSCRVYTEAERGFYCFGCGAGGTIYDFGAALWGLRTRGEDFRRLRRELAREFLTEAV
jgi:hypothetical protein